MNLPPLQSATVLWAIASTAFGAGLYMNHYASAASVERVANILAQHETKISALDERSKSIDGSLKNIEADYRQVLGQLWELAKTAHAPIIPPPRHMLADQSKPR